MVLGHDVLTSERTQDIKISEDVSFDTMLLAPNTLKGLKASGFYVPSPIQLHGIPLGKCGFDLLLEAKSGTGKTAVFSVIALEKLNLDKGVQALILAPTREIASQISDVIKAIGAGFKGLSVEVVMGGLPFTEDVERLKKKVHIVVGSPGRVHHLIKQKHIDVSSVRLMVLDEADKLVEKSFLPDINYIFSQLPSQKQIIMSSATYPGSVKTIMRNYVQNAHHICPNSSSILLGIKQNVIVVPCHVNIVKQTKNRYEELNKLLSKRKFKQCLVFCNYQVRVGEVHKMLTKDKWPADKLHGQQEQTVRLEALKLLQEYQCRILVTTDLAARGIDASNVDLVINFEIPYDWQTYLHRIGRAGRFGSYGRAITILCEGDEEKKFKKLLGSINIPFQLKYLWSKEPFELDLSIKKSDQIIIKEDVSQHNIEETEKQLGVKESYEEFWKMLSVDTNQPKNENLDIPTFESLCKSFEDVNKESNGDNIESFSDLLSSFQSHKIKSNENTHYKPIQVNKLIKLSTIFNRDIVLQSLKKHKSVITLAENSKNDDDNNNVTANDSKCGHNNIDLHKKKTVTSLSKKPTYENNSTSESTDSDSESIQNNIALNQIKSCESIQNGDVKDKESRPENGEPTGSESSEYTLSAKTNSNFVINRNTNSNSKIFSKVQLSKTKNTSLGFQKDNQKRPDESDLLSNKSENNYSDYASDNYVSPGRDDYEKLLLAANLPTAFGKAKQKNIRPKHKDVINKQYYHDKHRESIDIEHQKQPKIKTNFHKKIIVSESSAGEETEEDSFSLLHPRLHSKSSRKNVCSYSQNQPSCQLHHTRITKERNQQFNLWYQQLKKQMQMIEQSVYIAEMSSPD